jgi:hypothetical protein
MLQSILPAMMPEVLQRRSWLLILGGYQEMKWADSALHYRVSVNQEGDCGAALHNLTTIAPARCGWLHQNSDPLVRNPEWRDAVRRAVRKSKYASESKNPNVQPPDCDHDLYCTASSGSGIVFDL